MNSTVQHKSKGDSTMKGCCCGCVCCWCCWWCCCCWCCCWGLWCWFCCSDCCCCIGAAGFSPSAAPMMELSILLAKFSMATFAVPIRTDSFSSQGFLSFVRFLFRHTRRRRLTEATPPPPTPTPSPSSSPPSRPPAVMLNPSPLPWQPFADDSACVPPTPKQPLI